MGVSVRMELQSWLSEGSIVVAGGEGSLALAG